VTRTQQLGSHRRWRIETVQSRCGDVDKAALQWGPGRQEGGLRAGKQYSPQRRCALCQQFRRYYSYEPNVPGYHEDVAFYASGSRIENFPKQHSENCAGKHQNTNSWFKPMVCIFKNMRNRMIEQGLLAEGVAPSYFLEGMLYNVPNDKFGNSYADTWVECFNLSRTYLKIAKRSRSAINVG